MATQNNEGEFNATQPALLSFPNLLEAKAVERNGKPTGDAKFSANFELDPGNPDLEAIKRLAVKLAKERWPGRDLRTDFAFPWTNGDKLADKAKTKGKEREWSRGKVVLTARSKFDPRLSAIVNQKLVEFDGETARKGAGKHFFTGAEVLYQINLATYEGVGNNPDGVNAYLNMVLSTGKGERLAGGGRSAADVFKGYVGAVSGYDPTTGGDSDLDDEIPF